MLSATATMEQKPNRRIVKKQCVLVLLPSRNDVRPIGMRTSVCLKERLGRHLSSIQGLLGMIFTVSSCDGPISVIRESIVCHFITTVFYYQKSSKCYCSLGMTFPPTRLPAARKLCLCRWMTAALFYILGADVALPDVRLQGHETNHTGFQYSGLG